MNYRGYVQRSAFQDILDRCLESRSKRQHDEQLGFLSQKAAPCARHSQIPREAGLKLHGSVSRRLRSQFEGARLLAAVLIEEQTQDLLGNLAVSDLTACQCFPIHFYRQGFLERLF